MKYFRYAAVALVAGMLNAGHVVANESLSFSVHNLHFNNFTAHGHKANAVAHAVHRDTKGRLWIGTEGGLFLYDGHEVRSFLHQPGEAESLPANFVKSVTEARDGTIWIGTWGGGIAYFDEASRSIRVPQINRQAGLEKPFDGKIWSMLVDNEGKLWLGTFSSGLFSFDPRSGKLRAEWQPGPSDHPYTNRIESLYLDESERLWFSPYRAGVQIIDSTTGNTASGVDTQQINDVGLDVSDIAAFPDGRVVLSYTRAFAVFDSEGKLLRSMELATANSDGLIMEAQPYENDFVLLGTGSRLWFADVNTGDSFPLPAGARAGAVKESITWDIDRTDDGDLLVAGIHGVSIATSVSRQVWTIARYEGDRSYSFDITRAIAYEDNLLYLNSFDTLYAIEFDGELNRPRSLPGRELMKVPFGRPLSMKNSPEGGYWAGTDRAMYYVDTNGKAQKVLDGGAHTILFDEKFNHAIVYPGRMLSLDVPKPTQVRYPEPGVVDSPSRNLFAIRLAFGAHNDIWVGTFTSLLRYDRRTLEPLAAFQENVEGDEWPKNMVGNIEAIDKERILIGTSTGPYLAETNETGAIKKLTKLFPESRLGSISFSGIFPLGGGQYILYSDLGFVRYTLNSSEPPLLLFNDDGVPTFRPYMGGFHRFGDLAILSGEQGPLLFNPSTLDFTVPTRQIVITDILSFRGDSTKVWPLESGAEFRYEDKVIRFRFGMLDYLSPDNNEFQIRLKGFSDDWLNLDRVSEFSFTNLEPGEYTLEIRASDGGVSVPAGKQLAFRVLPPWWRTWWAYALYALLVFGSLFLYWLSLQRKIVREQEISSRLREADRIKSHFLNELESKVEDATQDLRHAVEALEIKNVELNAAQQRAVDASRLKSEFLANMSHEIRTPMNGVLGFTQLLQKSNLDNDQRDYVETIEKSANSLLGIINDVLDVSKIEAGKLIIDNSGFDLRECVADTLEALAPVAYEKNIELIGHVDENLPDGLRSDPTRMRQMLTNLVGNAIKFTDAGHVYVHVEKLDEESMRITVADTGRGISNEDRERLFQAFERGSVNLAGRYTGTGLGLVITKKLCEAMGGRIALDSVPGKGTSVTLEMPLVRDRNPENSYGFGKPLHGRKVLVIDPHTQSRDAIRARLAHWGAEVVALADLILPDVSDIDLAVVAVERIRLGDTRGLAALCSKLPPSLPRIGLAATVDREALHSLGESCKATFVSKVGHLENQLRRINEMLGRQAETAAEKPAMSSRLKGLHVLVADDNRINRYFLKKILELHGARITEADSGNAVLRQISSGNALPDIVLLDVHMPDIDGLEVARRIRADGHARLPLLAVSANVQPETHEAAIAAGVNDYLLKPVDENRLVEAVLEWTGREEVTS